MLSTNVDSVKDLVFDSCLTTGTKGASGMFVFLAGEGFVKSSSLLILLLVRSETLPGRPTFDSLLISKLSFFI